VTLNEIAMVNTNNKARREVLIWVALVVISMAAALVINVVLEIVNSPTSPPGGEVSGWEVNIREMWLALWYEHFIWFLGIFAVLGIVRVVFLFASSRTRS
jgi:hypothetical protein